MVVTIRLEGKSDFRGFDCRGRHKHLCDGCRLRFMCLSERNEIMIPLDVIKKHKIGDLKSLALYMFGEGRVNYEVNEHPSFGTTKLVMRVKNEG